MRGWRAASVAGSCLVATPTCASEPLLLRIRPTDDAAVARALREEVWTRSDRRARIAIASVCTGCMKPLPPVAAAPGATAAPDVAATGSTAATPLPQIAGDP